MTCVSNPADSKCNSLNYTEKPPQTVNITSEVFFNTGNYNTIKNRKKVDIWSGHDTPCIDDDYDTDGLLPDGDRKQLMDGRSF